MVEHSIRNRTVGGSNPLIGLSVIGVLAFMAATEEPIFISPNHGQPPKRLLILLHGWGADARDLAPLASIFNLPDYQFILPNAPFAHPEIPGGKAWYALETKDYKGLEESRQLLRDWILSLENTTGVPLSETILSGFSQGGAMTLDVGLTLPLAGLCSLSGYLHSQPQPCHSPLPPVLIVHGKQDSVVPLEAGIQARDKLTALGVQVQYQELDMGHEIKPSVVELMRSFLLTRVGEC